jgi:hypothetical protein
MWSPRKPIRFNTNVTGIVFFQSFQLITGYSPLLAVSGHSICLQSPSFNVRYSPKAAIQNRALEESHRMAAIHPEAVIGLQCCGTTANDPKRTLAPLMSWENEMGYRRYCTISGVLFSLVALAHLLRIVYGMSIQVDEYVVPMFVSWIGLAVPAGLTFWAFRINRDSSVA